MEKVVLKFFTMDNGEPFVMIDGASKMQGLHAINLAIKMMYELFKGTRFLLVLDEYG